MKNAKNKIAINIILISMLCNTSCSFSNEKQNETVTAASIASSESDDADDEFTTELPVHKGVWEVAEDGFIDCYYEFSGDYSGRKLKNNSSKIEAFTYEKTKDNTLVLHFEDRDEYANYNIGEDGKHLVLTYKEYQETLLWVSHGTFEDMGGLGLTFEAEDVTPFGLELKYTQKDGDVTGEITADQEFCVIIYDEETDDGGYTSYFGNDGEELVIDKDSSGSLSVDWTEVVGALEPGNYVLKFRIRDIRNNGGDWDSFDYRVWFTVPEYEDSQRTSTLQDSSSIEPLSIKTDKTSDSYSKKGSEPRETWMDLSLDYYSLSGDVSEEFLTRRKEYFDAISTEYDELKKRFEDYIVSDEYKDLDSVSGMNNNTHSTTEYLERNDKLLYSSIVVSSGSYGGDWYCSYNTFNYDVQKQKEIMLSDVVTDLTAFKLAIIKAINENPPSIGYTSDFSEYAYILDDTYYNKEDTESGTVNWTLDSEGLTIYFSAYQISNDPCKYTIPYSSEVINEYYILLEGNSYQSEYNTGN